MALLSSFATSGYAPIACIGILILTKLWASRGLVGSNIPGPWLAKHTKLWYLWQMYREDFHQTNVKLHREYGEHKIKQKEREDI